MGVPVSQMWTVASYVIGQKLRGRKQFPVVLMLEPLFRCNLACAGCGKIQYPAHILKTDLTPEQCFKAVDECGAPMVSIPGGEPLMHPQIDEIVEGLVARKKYVYLCTNALLLKEKIDQFKPSKYLSFVVHMDGQREHHDFAVCREGTYDKAVEGIQEALKRGFRVTTNTTLFDGADAKSVRAFFDEMMDLGRRGHDALSRLHLRQGARPGALPEQEENAPPVPPDPQQPPQEVALQHEPALPRVPDGQAASTLARPGACRPTTSSAGRSPATCCRTATPTLSKNCCATPSGNSYGTESGNPKCANCMVHSGYEASAVNDTFGSLSGFAATVRATLFDRYNDPDVDDDTPMTPRRSTGPLVQIGAAPDA